MADLPELPEPFCNAHEDAGSYWPDMYSGHQMRAYGAEVRRQALEDAARVCDDQSQEYEPFTGRPLNLAYQCAAAVRALKERQ